MPSFKIIPTYLQDVKKNKNSRPVRTRAYGIVLEVERSHVPKAAKALARAYANTTSIVFACMAELHRTYSLLQSSTSNSKPNILIKLSSSSNLTTCQRTPCSPYATISWHSKSSKISILPKTHQPPVATISLLIATGHRKPKSSSQVHYPSSTTTT